MRLRRPAPCSAAPLSHFLFVQAVKDMGITLAQIRERARKLLVILGEDEKEEFELIVNKPLLRTKELQSAMKAATTAPGGGARAAVGRRAYQAR